MNRYSKPKVEYTYNSPIELKHREIIMHFLNPPRPKMLIKILNHIYNGSSFNKFIPIRPSTIIKLICRYYNLSRYELLSKSRATEIVKARQLGMYLMRKYSRMSTYRIGKVFNKDHATVIYATKQVINHCDTEKKYKYEFDELIKLLER